MSRRVEPSRQHALRQTTLLRQTDQGSIEMNTMHEALARERMRVDEREAQQHRVAKELAAARRWHRLEQRVRAVQRRHAQRAS
ncbi:MAG: hypothetical protein QOK11_1934 [Pseudonocardiales bacterium]|nr:hypothetical protein [Pseudonocardiales bacterium]